MKKTKCLVILSWAFISLPVFCFEQVNTCDLLMSYLENDTALKSNVISAEKAQLSLDSTKINNGFDLSLSTGNFTFSYVEGNSSISVKPSVVASFPMTSKLKVSASSDLNYKNAEFQASDIKLNSSIDIISSSNLTREINLLKAERNLMEARQKLQNQAINCEKSFYTELKRLLTSTNNIISTEKSLYTNKIDFEKIKAQNYSASSSTYRLAQMKVLSSEHEIENLKRALLHDYTVFYKKCGYDVSLSDSMDFYDLIPTDISEVEPLDIHSFKEDLYTEVESALWTHKVNSLQRKVNNNFSLSANAGVTFLNSTTKSPTIDTGLSTVIGGLTADAGLSFPIGNGNIPSVNFSATIKPNDWKINSIKEQSNILDEKQELLAIENARTNYATKVVDMEQSLIDLQWKKTQNEESYQMYVTLENDLAKWYKDGYISESEYYSAKVNVLSATVEMIMNKIDFIIYNDDIVTMFVNEIQGEIDEK